MALTLLLCVILPLMTTAMECPNGIEVDTTCYNRSHVLTLKKDLSHEIFFNQLGILRKNRTLYYSYGQDIEEPPYHKVGFINLDDQSQFGEISPPDNVPMNFGCFDIDQDNAIIYLGSSDGIKRFDPFYSLLTHISSPGKTILSISFKDNVYFVRDGEFMIMFKKEGALKSLLADDEYRTHKNYLPNRSVRKFVMINNNTVVFLGTKGLFTTKTEKNSEIYRLSKSGFHGLAADLHGEVYTWKWDGIYKVVFDTVKPARGMVIKVANIPSIGALTFDTDNSILYVVEKSLFRLVKYDDERAEDE